MSPKTDAELHNEAIFASLLRAEQIHSVDLVGGGDMVRVYWCGLDGVYRSSKSYTIHIPSRVHGLISEWSRRRPKHQDRAMQ